MLSNLSEDVRSILTFFTIIPMGGSHDVLRAFRRAWLAIIIVPPITGLIPGFVGFYLWVFTHNNLLSASLAYALLLILTGLNHIDGFSDVIDALMVRGSVEERIKVLKDPHRGSAAIAMVVLLIAVAISALTGLPNYMWQSLFTAEIASKAACCLSALIGREPPYRGLGWQLTVSIKESWYYVAVFVVIGLSIVYVIMGFLGLVISLGSVVVSVLLFLIIQRSFGGAVGDLYGFTLEVSRVISLLLLTIFINVLSYK
ncbi:MAG: adenosylcobinamide-GDP ribazoletransferase [Vulcanisaeta sp. AZ3]